MTNVISLPKLRASVPLVEPCRFNDVMNPLSTYDVLSFRDVFEGYARALSWEVIK